MKLHHGSNMQIKEIDFSKSKTNKDFGCGFYLSDNYTQAQELAQFKKENEGGDAIVSTFEFDETAMSSGELDVKIFDSYSMEWAEFVLENRKNDSRAQIHPFDVVYGPIANDRVGLQIRRLENGDIDMHTFLERLKYMKGITFQYFFGTEKSLKFLSHDK